MNKDRLAGAALLLLAAAGITVYTYRLFLAPPWVEELVVKLTAFGVAASLALVAAWIGLTLIVSPPPKPIRDIREELESQFGKLQARGTSGED